MYRRNWRALLALLLALAVLPLSLWAEAPKDSLRVHYQNDNNAYEGLGVWFWQDVVTPSEKTGSWPDGRTVFPPENITENGACLDIQLSENPAQVGLLVIDASGTKYTPEDLLIDLISPDMREVWVNDRLEVFYEDQRQIPDNHLRIRYLSPESNYEGMGVWFWGDVVTPSEKTGSWPTGATPMTIARDTLGAYVDIELIPDAKQVGYLFVNRDSGEQTQDYLWQVRPGIRVVYMREGDDTQRTNPYATEAAAAPAAEIPVIPWQQIDEEYYTEEPLGATLHEDGSATLRLWAPTADAVEAVLYAAHKQDFVLRDKIPMEKNGKGVWSVTLSSKNTPVKTLEGAFYQFRVIRGDREALVLDPYAKSMAAWNSANGGVGKAAIVNPDAIGPELTFANIPGFETREDAIIYEAHVRDFTSDPSLEGSLQAPFGTFLAFAEKLDYLKDLGVTHIQLLPVCNYYHVDENNRERELAYASENQNYNWGYDPHSYFALTGMYATDPTKPEVRIREFKQLVDLIHQKGMGVILDVVYNHTARVELLEDIQPNYYYFMDKNGKPKGSFGGGQVGSTHLMTRRLIADSLVYLTDTYKVDGFRFDMMGNLDGQTLEEAYGKVSAINPQTLWIGEGWRTFNGDYGVIGVQAADQGFMGETDNVAVFSDEVRNELKSGFGIEGQPRFLTGGKRPISLLFNNVQARPSNVSEDDPGDIVQYIEAHDNLTLFDVIALSIKKDPVLHEAEILRRVRMGNALLLTHQGIIFLHSGQEYGRTKQFLHPDYQTRVDTAPAKSTFMADETGTPFAYPYFIHDSYDSSDAVNRFDWGKAQGGGDHQATVEYTRGLIAIRRSTDAFSYDIAEDIDQYISLVLHPEAPAADLLLSFMAASKETGDTYLVAVNADSVQRTLDLSNYAFDLGRTQVLADGARAGTAAIENPVDVQLVPGRENDWLIGELVLEPLTAVILKTSE